MKKFNIFPFTVIVLLLCYFYSAQSIALSKEKLFLKFPSFRSHQSATPSDPGHPVENRGYSKRAPYETTPTKIALLLPLAGENLEAAKALREGFQASYYETPRYGMKPTIRVYDTTNTQDIQSIYERAVNEGADLVVGPLTKDEVYRLSFLPPYRLKAPVLALNSHVDIRMTPKHFVQFSLSPEEEAIQLSEKAWKKGFKNASVIVPDNRWGKRIAETFIRHWQQQGGFILRTVYANPSQDQAYSVRKLLNIDEEFIKSTKTKSGASKKEEFVARRKNLDVIIMAAPPVQARQLKPLLDFYYAEEVPVYATSSIYSGYINPKRDKDLNGIVFCDMPWLIEPDKHLLVRTLLERQGQNKGDQYNRLFAMGVDCYYLAMHFRQLHAGETYLGATGNLFLDNHHHIQRRLAWSVIKNGVPTPLPTINNG